MKNRNCSGHGGHRQQLRVCLHVGKVPTDLGMLPVYGIFTAHDGLRLMLKTQQKWCAAFSLSGTNGSRKWKLSRLNGDRMSAGSTLSTYSRLGPPPCKYVQLVVKPCREGPGSKSGPGER